MDRLMIRFSSDVYRSHPVCSQQFPFPSHNRRQKLLLRARNADLLANRAAVGIAILQVHSAVVADVVLVALPFTDPRNAMLAVTSVLGAPAAVLLLGTGESH
ncbi:hypothetical protein BC567DRAFT_234392 [Phyllosticta citribraziliensis]